MSYILEALKKAQAERQIGSTPTIHAPTLSGSPASANARASRTPLIVALVLMGAVVAGLAAMLLKQGAAPAAPSSAANAQAPGAATAGPASATPTAMPAASPAVAAPAPAAPIASVDPAVAAPTAAQSATAAQPSPPPPATAPAAGQPGAAAQPTPPPGTVLAAAQPPAAQPAPTGRPVPQPSAAAQPAPSPSGAGRGPAAAPPAPMPTPSTAAAPVEEHIQSLQELPEPIQRAIPPIALGGYMYSKNPADRLLLIDKALRREGEEVAPGLVLEKLQPKQAVFSFRGYRYRVPL